MKKILLPMLIFSSMVSTVDVNAQAWSENFNSGIPSAWKTINDGNTPNSGLGSLATKLTAKAWDTLMYNGTNYMAVTTSWFTNVVPANRWLITPKFIVSAGFSLQWSDIAFDANYADSIQILVSPTADTIASSFTTTLYNNSATPGAIGQHAVSLSAYAGQTIRIAFRENSTDEYILGIDDVAVTTLPSADLAITSIAPSASSPVAYGTVGSAITLTGKLKNNGSSTITNYTLNYKQGTNATVSMPMTTSIASLGTATFTATTPYTIPSVGVFPISAWVTLTGDVNHSNDSATTTLNGVSFMPKKRLVFEESSGTWCGWCIRGTVFMDSFSKNNGGVATQICVHNGDPMTVTAYDSKITAITGGSFPNMVIDRREYHDPSYIFDYYNAEKNYFGFAAITLPAPSMTGSNLNVAVTVKPAINMSGDYRLAMVVTEDGVTAPAGNTATNWKQHSYYSSLSTGHPAAGSLVYEGVDYLNRPDYITDPYKFVARGIYPSATGAAGSLPSTMTSGTSYNYTFAAVPFDASWNKANLNVAVLLIDNATGYILNSENTRIKLSAATIGTIATDIQVYPNPAADIANIDFSLNHPTEVKINLTDATGRLINEIANDNFTSGKHSFEINTNNLSTGIYFIKISTTEGTTTQRLSIVK